MELSRPDLSTLDPAVRAYIEGLEAEIERLKQASPTRTAARPRRRDDSEEMEEPGPEIFEPAEPETTIHVISLTGSGVGKRTPRHLYHRQRRGGMGVFDLEAPGDEAPRVLALADISQNLLLITNLARAFRMPAAAISEGPVRGKGESIVGKLNLLPGEEIAAILPEQAQGYVALASQRGNIRLLRHHVFGEYMKPGMSLYDQKLGPLAAACWTPGDGDLFLATRQGKGIRFPEKLVPPAGGLGLRLTEDDVVVGVAPVYEDSNVFMLAADGKGTLRNMETFSANKAPGAGGKAVMNTDELMFVQRVEPEDDIFIISRLSKIIRFQAGQVPVKEGAVQGVICMSLRSDDCVAAAINPARDGFGAF